MLKITVDSDKGIMATEFKGNILQMKAEAIAAVSDLAENIHKVTGQSVDQILDDFCSIAKQVSKKAGDNT